MSHEENNSSQVPPRKLQYGKECDVTFIFPKEDGVVLETEKHILKEVSEVFRKILPESGDSDLNRIAIMDITLAIFGNIVEFIYNHEKTGLDVSEENYRELLYAAKKYSIYAVIHKIVDFLLEFITHLNFAEHFEFLVKYEIQPLKEHMMNICVGHPLNVIKTLNASEAHKGILRMILESNTLICREFDLHNEIKKMMIRNGKGKPEGASDGSEMMRKELGSLIHLIRFPSMTRDELIECSLPPCFLTDKEVKYLLLWVNHEIFSETIELFNLKPRYKPHKSRWFIRNYSLAMSSDEGADSDL